MNDKLLEGLTFAEEDKECGYFKDIPVCENYITAFHWKEDWENIENKEDYEQKAYTALLEYGLIREGKYFYQSQCGNCRKCTPIRLIPEHFKPSKSQKAVLKKNQDIEIRIVKDPKEYVTDEKARMLSDYYNHHNPDDEKITPSMAKNFLSSLASSYSGFFLMEFYCNGRLIGVSELDISKDDQGKDYALVSKYFFYDLSPETLKRSIGVFSVLKEIEYCQKNNISYYYLGLFIKDCRKMNYKTNYKPYELFLNSQWFPLMNDPEVIDFDHPYTFPAPGELYDRINLCQVTEEITNHLLYSAYRQGIFPWFDEDQGEPVLWQCPTNRYVIYPENIHIPKSLKKEMKKSTFTFTMDKCFTEVIKNCRNQTRKGQNGTWIGDKIIQAYTRFHKAGFAHSFEVWKEGKLAGGFYGILMGSLFCGESMFTIESGSSKEAFVHFAQAFAKAGGKMIDCQMYTENMGRYQGEKLSRRDYLKKIADLIDSPLSGKIEI